MKKILLFAVMVIGLHANVRDRIDLDSEFDGLVLRQILTPFSASKAPQY